MFDIRYFARLSECVGRSRELLESSDIDSVEQIVALLKSRGEPWQTQFSGKLPVLVAINQQMATCESAVQPNDEIAFFPPVTGG